MVYNEVYVDGQMMGNGVMAQGGLEIDPNGLWLGQRQGQVGGGFDPDHAYIGLMDELQTSDRALSASEVLAMYMQQKRMVEMLQDAAGSTQTSAGSMPSGANSTGDQSSDPPEDSSSDDAGQGSDPVELPDSNQAVPGSDPASFAEVIARVVHGVVRIETEETLGTGMIVGVDGLILTAVHVIEDDTSPKIMLENGLGYQGKLVGMDLSRDVALLKIEAPGDLPTVRLDSSEISQGDEVVALGYALDLPGMVSATKGIVSAIRSFGDVVGFTGILIQTDAALNVGVSGGPLINKQGTVVGMNTASLVLLAENVGFAVSSDSILESIDKVMGSVETSEESSDSS